jgi:HK97 family phage portal protein
LISGNCYITPELIVLPSAHVYTEEGTNPYLPILYRYESSISKIYPVNQVTGECELTHIKMYNPLSLVQGLSPLEAAGYSIDLHNMGMQWNSSLLQHSAQPSSILTVPENSFLTPEQKESISDAIKSYRRGGSKNGGVLILEGGLQHNQSSLSPTDMDFRESLNTASRNIAAVLGVPFALVIPDSATYSNMETARESLYENTVIPLLDKICKALSKDGTEIRQNLDGISALENRRERKFNRVINGVKSGILTINEGRAELGFEPVEGLADELLVPRGTVPLGTSFDVGADFER